MDSINTTPIALLREALEKGISVFLDDGKLRLKVAKDKAVDVAFINILKSHKESLRAFLVQQAQETQLDAVRRIETFDRATVTTIPLSFSQERLWFMNQLENNDQFHMPFVLSFEGNIDIDVLEYAFQQIINRHEALRTVFQDEDGIPYQKILAPNQWSLDTVEALDETNVQLEQIIESYTSHLFDLSKDHPIRVQVIQTSPQNYTLVCVIHHIASDGWSESIIVSELVRFYEAKCASRSPKVEALPIQYADYAVWQRNYLQGEVLDKKLNYWAEQLNGVEPLNLPTDFPRPTVQSTNGKTFNFNINNCTLEGLQQIAKEQEVTMFMVLMATFQVLLYKYSKQEDICVGTPIANRTQAEIERLVGFFINTLAIRGDLSDNPSFATLLQQVKATTLDAYTYQDVPFEKIVDKITQGRDQSRTPIFQSMFMMQNTEEVNDIKLGEATLLPQDFDAQNAKYDLTLSISETNNSLEASFEYCSDLFAAATIERMAQHFQMLLSAITKNPNQTLQQLDILTAAERQRLLVSFNDNAADIPTDKTLIDLFEAQVQARPDAVAIVFENKELTFKELDERSNQLGHYLRNKGVKEEDLVALCIERSLEMMIGILGILKAGGAYVPIDPSYPSDRMQYILENSNARFLLTDNAASQTLQIQDSVEIVLMDAHWSMIQQESAQKVENDLTAQHLAYVIYTSGSTGKPKGVMNQHDGVVNRLVWMQEDFQLQADKDVFLQKTTFCFDISVWEFFWPLMTGIKLVFARPGGHKDSDYLKQIVKEQQITLIHFVPSMLDVFLMDIEKGDCASLDRVLCTGEPLKPSHVALFQEKFDNVLLYNLYGPTEAAIEVTGWKVPVEQASVDKVLIGTPASNTSIYMLNENLQPTGIGVPGELHIGGIQVARGYYNRPDLTAEKFIADPFSDDSKARLYKTGDLARWLADGTIEFFGRIDSQVKIRGNRIELGEIESVLDQLPSVTQSAVIDKDDANGVKHLVAYVITTATDFNKDTIQNHLREQLPEYMVPSIVIPLEEMPLTPNGKVNRKAFPNPNLEALVTTEYVAPRSIVEMQLAQIWQQLLKIEKVGIYDDFFELGGNSLLAIRLVSAIRKKMATEVSTKEIFSATTIAQLTQLLASKEEATSLPPIVAQTYSTPIPLSFAQERLWFIDKLEGSTHYHIPFRLQIEGTIDQEALTYAFQQLMERQQVLRTIYKDSKEGTFQSLLAANEWVLDYKNAFNYLPEAKEHHIQQYISKAYDLSADYMLRAQLIKTGATTHTLVCVLHHIATDGWSIPIIVQEFMAFYNAKQQNTPVDLPELTVQYADYAVWQRQYLEGAVLDQKLHYWEQQLQNIEPLNLPIDFARPAIQSNEGAVQSFTIDAATTARLHECCKEEKVTLFMVLLSAFQVLLHKYSGQTDICVGSPSANRNQVDIEPLVGFFVNTLSLRSDLSNNPSIANFLQQVKATTLDAYQHQDVSFEKIVERVVTTRDQSRTPLFQTMLVLQNNEKAADLVLGDATVSTLDLKETTAKYELTLRIGESEAGMEADLEYCTALFSPATIERMVQHFSAIVSAIAENTEQSIQEITILGDAERQQLLVDFNDYTVDYPSTKTFVDLFEQQVQETPQKEALIFGKNSLTYQQLNEQSNQLAHYLRKRGVQANSSVAFCIQDAQDMAIVSLLGILKAGGAYVPIDPAMPQERIQYILDNTKATIVIGDAACRDTLSTINNVERFYIDEDWSLVDQESTQNSTTKAKPSDLVYIIHTSGSTGQPKGVMLSHRNLMDYIFGLFSKVNMAEMQSFGLMSTMSADLGNTVLYGALATGNTLHLFDKTNLMDANEMYTYFSRYPIDCIKIVPSHWNALENKAGILLPERCIIFGGEELSIETLEKIKAVAPHLNVVNHYGPTETTIGKLLYPVNLQEENRIIPIGKPFSNTKVYVVDKDLSLCPIGVIGELLIGGDGVSQGYINRPDLTEERFIPNPFSDDKQDIVYRTGDLVAMLPDGNIVFKGRVDDQVKIRGYRVELGEIKAVLDQSPYVKQSAVSITTDANSTSLLVAYIVANGYFNKAAIEDFLKEQLPHYMVPSIWMELESIPLNANGKIDRKKLPKPNVEDLLETKYIAPRNEVEQTLANIWKELLQVEQVGVLDNFFELGGHSLLAIRLATAIKEAFQLMIPVQTLFNYTTIEQLAKYIRIIQHQQETSSESENATQVVEL